MANFVHSADKALDFTLPDLENKDFNLYERLQKGPVLIDFWATWCKPCIQALPYVDDIHKKYAEQGLQTVAITIDNPRGKSKVKPFVKSQGYSFEVLYDISMEVRKMFGGQDIPYTVLINQSGEIVYRHLGYSPGDEKKLGEAVAKLFEKKNDI